MHLAPLETSGEVGARTPREDSVQLAGERLDSARPIRLDKRSLHSLDTGPLRRPTPQPKMDIVSADESPTPTLLTLTTRALRATVTASLDALMLFHTGGSQLRLR
jgi:hypothetical protein